MYIINFYYICSSSIISYSFSYYQLARKVRTIVITSNKFCFDASRKIVNHYRYDKNLLTPVNRYSVVSHLLKSLQFI